MLHRLIIAVVAVWSLFSSAYIKRSVMMHVVEEEINGIIFVHRIDTIDNVRKELWVVNGQQVSEDEYFDQVMQAEVVQHKIQRKKEIEKIREQQAFVAREQRAVVKRLIQQCLQRIEKYVNKLSDVRLSSYIDFKMSTIPSREAFDTFISQELARAQTCLSIENEQPLSLLQDVLVSIQSYPEKLVALYQDTLQVARERSDDTRLLKDLLHLVSESADV